MTDHTYAGYTAEQIRAAAEAASPGTWREQRYMSDGKVGYGIVDGGRGLFIGEHRLMPFCETDRRHIVTSQPETVLALLDRIAELEQRAVAAEGWHLIETNRADEMLESARLDGEAIDRMTTNMTALVAKLAQLKVYVDTLQADAERYRWLRDRCGIASTPLSTPPRPNQPNDQHNTTRRPDGRRRFYGGSKWPRSI